MSKISDEIREFVRRSYADEHMDPRELLALADRIDREMFVLPKTADGVPIHVGDTAYTDDVDGFEIVQISIDQDKPRIVCSTGSDLDIMRLPSSVFHTRPDSLERIADELDAWVDRPASYKEHKEFHTFADRIRKLAAKED